jgi:LPPG:FO 2-phospho-L-lactate transferase
MALNSTEPNTEASSFSGPVVAFAGGVGGAKLADGLMQVLPVGTLTVIVNTGDDFTHYGLNISPDLDTVMYTLSGLADPINGWGLAGDTRQMIGMMQRYGDEAWFGLGDKDVATHLLRTQALASGATLSEVTASFASTLGIPAHVLPMTNDRVSTVVETVERGTLSFQEYFVRHRWQPTVTHLRYEGADSARPAIGVLEAIENASAIIICPSNPLLSIEPILQVSGVRAALERRSVPCVAVSPIIAGQAVKGPAAKLMRELGKESSVVGIADYYGKLIDGLVMDELDRDVVVNQRSFVTNTLMKTLEDRARLAKEVLSFTETLK